LSWSPSQAITTQGSWCKKGQVLSSFRLLKHFRQGMLQVTAPLGNFRLAKASGMAILARLTQGRTVGQKGSSYIKASWRGGT
jgi:hypothetical protein